MAKKRAKVKRSPIPPQASRTIPPKTVVEEQPAIKEEVTTETVPTENKRKGPIHIYLTANALKLDGNDKEVELVKFKSGKQNR